MSNDTNLEFIREKINQVRSAIMYSYSDDVIRIPNNIVSAVKVDEEGQLWFVCDRPPYMPEQYPSSFPARLHFYRKGKFFHIEVSGPASIINDVQHDSNSAETRMLIKMEMKNIIYTETPDKHKSGMEMWLNRTSTWILQHIGVSKQPKPFLNSLMTVDRH
ncbi:MAG: hypothetical protein ABI675_27135 [Chitinophagaceae bacterium]